MSDEPWDELIDDFNSSHALASVGMRNGEQTLMLRFSNGNTWFVSAAWLIGELAGLRFLKADPGDEPDPAA